MKTAPAGLSLVVFLPALAAVTLAGFGLGRWCRPATFPYPVHPEVTAACQPPEAALPSADTPPFETIVANTSLGDYQRRLQLAQAVAPLGRAELRAALERERARLLDSRSDDFLPAESLLARYAGLDPEDALAWIKEVGDHRSTPDECNEAALGTWVALDPTSALAWGKKQDKDMDDYAAVLGQLACVDPQLTVQLLSAAVLAKSDVAADTDSIPSTLNAVDVMKVFENIAQRDLPLARDHALLLPPKAAAAAASMVAKVWMASGEPAEVYGWATQISSPTVRAAAIRWVYAAWGERDPAAAAASMAARGGPELLANAADLAGNWTERDPGAALAWSQLLPAAARADALDSVLVTWSGKDPRAAAQYAATLPRTGRSDNFSFAVKTWAGSDREAALAWSETLPPGPFQRDALESVCEEWETDDPRACAEYLTRQPDQAVDKGTWEAVISAWAQANPDKLWQWSRSLADPKRSTAAAKAAVDQIAPTDPVAASTLLGQLPPAAQKESAGKVTASWANIDPAAAAQWASGLPAGDAQTAAFKSLAESWGDQDAPGAAAWIESQPASAATDAATVSLLSENAAQLVPADAIRLARHVQDEGDRTDALQSVARAWLEQDHAAASTWIQSVAEFTPETRSKLLESDE